VSIERLLAPRSMAIVGTSPSGGRGTRVHSNVLAAGFPGALYAVHPRQTEVLGTRAYQTLADLPEVVDCVILAVPADTTLELLSEAGRLGIGGAVCLASGFAEAGARGLERQQRLKSIAHASGMVVCGPNCVGLWSVREHVAAFSPPLPGAPAPGGVALISQSGGLLLEVLNPLIERGVGLSHVVSTGNEGATTMEEYLAHLVEQSEVRLVAAIVESFKAPERLRSVLERARALGKPVLVLKVGRSEAGQRAAASHTGSLAEDDAVVDAVLREAGALRMRGTDHLIESAVLFSTGRRPSRPRVALVSSSGGRCTLLGDLAARVSLDLTDLDAATQSELEQLLPDFGHANNPLDPTGVVFDRDGLYAPMLAAVARDPDVGLVGVFQVTRSITAADAQEQRTHRSVALAEGVVSAAQSSETPLVAFASLTGGRVDPQVVDVFRAGGVPLLLGMEAALAAMKSALEYGQHTPRRAPANWSAPDIPAALREHLARDGALSEYDGKRLLAAYGVPVVEGALATNAARANDIARELSYPVVMKANAPGIAHKSERGLVRLGVTEDQVASVFAELGERVLVERKAAPGVELIIGARATPFGPVIMVGAGGVLAELVRDTRLRLAPLAHDEALDLLAETRVWPLLEGYRGRPRCDVDAVCAVMVAVSRMVCDLELGELDINPLLVYERGVVAVDALVRA